MFHIKRYIVFIGSFIVLHFGYTLLSGFLLTSIYVPSTSLAMSEAVAEVSPTFNSIVYLLIATLAYYISQHDVLTVRSRTPHKTRS